MVLNTFKYRRTCVCLWFSTNPLWICNLLLWIHQSLSPPWFINPCWISRTLNMNFRLAIKFPTPVWVIKWPVPRKIKLSNSLPPGQENAQGMPRKGEMLLLWFDWYIIDQRKIVSPHTESIQYLMVLQKLISLKIIVAIAFSSQIIMFPCSIA